MAMAWPGGFHHSKIAWYSAGMIDFDTLTAQRHSVRAFTNQPVTRQQVEDICTIARRAPSGANLQPGTFHVLTGKALAGLSERLMQAVQEGAPIESEYSYFPRPMPPALKSRQREAGYALYQALGIGRRDVQGRRDQFARNYAFFGAPVGIVVTIDRAMGKGCFMDLGMSLMAMLLAAEAAGLGATGIGALANYGSVVHGHLDLPPQELVVCGVALGHPDRTAAVNRFRTTRAALSEFTSFRGFD
jgi:nitroreductase